MAPRLATGAVALQFPQQQGLAGHLVRLIQAQKEEQLYFLQMTMRPNCILLILVCIALYGCNPRSSLEPDFRAHRKKYEDIVQAAKALPVPNGTNQEVTLSGLPVYIERDDAGLYIITITAKSLGHEGDYGYIYADAILVTQPDVNYPSERSLGNASDMPFVDKQIDPHWWSVYNNLK